VFRSIIIGTNFFVINNIAFGDLYSPTRYIKWSGAILALPTYWILGWHMGYYHGLACAAFQIWTNYRIEDNQNRGGMQKIGDKENIGDIKKQLEACIKVILKEDSDSEALAKERMKVIIAPILEAISL
jgi:hypothetical protein